MQEIQQFNQQLIKQRRSSSILVGILLASGFIASVPMFSDSIKHEETLYCNVKSSCHPSKIKKGISFLVDRERRNQLFDNNINVVKILPPEDPKAVSYGLCASLFLLSAYGVSKALTDSQEKSIHSQLKLLKIKALETDIIEQTHIDLFGFSKSNQAEITKQVIARQTTGTLQRLKSEGEVQLDRLNGQLQGQLSLKSHQLQLSELDKETAKNNFETLETQKKIDRLNKPVQDAKQSTPNEELKNRLVEVLKGHEDGWLWTVIKAAKPLWIIGEQGTGKTNTSVAIALIRKYCLNIPVYRIADRHLNGANSKVWKLLEPQIKADN
ncbi:MAG: hypothetical protein ACK6A9_14080, partial [Dolichospermum sp.]